MSIEWVTLITTVKKLYDLIDSVYSYFTFDWNYFWICIILGVSSFEWWNNHLESMCNGGDISGLREGPASVVVRVHFPNNNSQLIFDPNNNTPTKFKQIYLFQEKCFFHISYKRYRKDVGSNFVERVELSYWPKVHENSMLVWVK